MPHRHYTQVKANIVRPLEFDYSQPVALSTVDLRDPPNPPQPLLSLLSQTLGFSDPPLVDHQLPYLPYKGEAAGSAPAPQNAYAAAPPAGWHGDGQGGKGRGEVGEGIARALRPGQSVKVDVTLELPVNYHELYQVRG